MIKFKLDTDEEKKERKAIWVITKAFHDTGFWIVRLQSGKDYGVDALLEMIEHDNFILQKTANCQIKGRTDIKLLKNKEFISFPLDVATYNQAVLSNSLFLLLLVNLETEDIYFYKLNKCGELSTNSATINIHIPLVNKFPENESALRRIFNNF